MSSQPALPPQPEPALATEPAVGVAEPFAEFYSAGVTKLFIPAVMRHLPEVLENLCHSTVRLSQPGGADLGSYLAAERIWSDGLRIRVHQLAQECLPLTEATLAIALTENLLRSELSRVTRAAIDEVVDGKLLGAEAAGVKVAGSCMERVRMGLHAIATDAVS